MRIQAFAAKGENQVVNISFPPRPYIGWKQVYYLRSRSTSAMLRLTL